MDSSKKLYKSCSEGLFFLAGPCVIEGKDIALKTAYTLAEIAHRLGITLIYKSSFDKANRTSVTSYRGPGLENGLRILEEIKRETGLPIVTDIHSADQAKPVAEVADVLQIPAFLCRQTDLLVAAGNTQKIINVKKGQFLAPLDMKHIVGKVQSTGNEKIWLTERGSSFGYNNLVVDMRSINIMSGMAPVVFDATHSVQLPGGKDGCSGGQREFVPVLAKAAVGAGAAGVFMEVHPDPDTALCDGPNSLALNNVESIVQSLLKIYDVQY